MVYLNEGLLKKAGLTADQVNLADWAALPALNAKLASVSGGRLDRIGIDPKIPEFLPMWAKANGVDMLSADGRTAKLDDPKVIEALTTGVNLIRQQGGWGAFKSFRDTFDFFGAQNPLSKNQIVAWPMEEWFLNQAAKNSPTAELVVKPFVDRQGKPLTQSAGQAWVITKGAKNPDAACAFVKKMTATDTWWPPRRPGSMPARLPASRSPASTPPTPRPTRRSSTSCTSRPATSASTTRWQTIRSVQDAAFALPASPAGAEFDKAYYDAVNRVLAGQATAGAGVAASAAGGHRGARPGREVVHDGHRHPSRPGPAAPYAAGPAGGPLGVPLPGALDHRVSDLLRRADARQPLVEFHRVRRDQRHRSTPGWTTTGS